MEVRVEPVHCNLLSHVRGALPKGMDLCSALSLQGRIHGVVVLSWLMAPPAE